MLCYGATVQTLVLAGRMVYYAPLSGLGLSVRAVDTAECKLHNKEPFAFDFPHSLIYPCFISYNRGCILRNIELLKKALDRQLRQSKGCAYV